MSPARVALLTSFLTVIQIVSCNNEVFFVQKSPDKSDYVALSVNWSEDGGEINAECDIIYGRDQVMEALRSVSYRAIDTITEKQLQEYLEECDNVNEIRYEEIREIQKASKTKTTETNSDSTTEGYNGIPVIFPGTKWCGAGDKAKSYDDLGLHQDTDRCCRAHDLCNDTMAPGQTKNGLTNKSPFTKLSCQCDEDFYNCLDRVNSVTSNTIGNTYFNLLRRECYKVDYPDSDKCKKYKTFFKIKCIEYEKDKNAPKEYKWIRTRKYKKIPFPGPLTVTLPNIIPF